MLWWAPGSIGPFIRVFIKCQLHLFPSVLVIKTQGGSCLQKGTKNNEVNSLPGSSGTGAEVGPSNRSYIYPRCTTAWPLISHYCLLATSMFPVFNINYVIFSTQLWVHHLIFFTRGFKNNLKAFLPLIERLHSGSVFFCFAKGFVLCSTPCNYVELLILMLQNGDVFPDHRKD